ncbi:NapC/NirT family cytochrome c [Salipiger mangrovisoli]|uniref:Cytochrome c-type protein n=1 Tax=Salipiger mangrovisoli TaxID=2865933 RepID=A0ABR9X460_9RHOB|nr:NapC/NirT family cytochrome c [Salipiger mangrovisoli]MBE9638296.1 NapC/NirT family cytochrome c [Salipiger mangrovisoli]
MRFITGIFRWFWGVVTTPATTLGLGFLVLGGFIGGVLFWGGFNTALEITNTEEFCISCHEMKDNVYEELSHTVHFSNRSGVRAECPACHVPHEWTRKIARKMQASKEVWGKIFGTIDTRQKFLEHRIVLAKREWARLKANDSLECRNCHTAVAMDLSKQSPRAANIHSQYMLTGQRTCIDCHKGIAHQLPDMTGVEPGWIVPDELRGNPGGTDGAEIQSYLLDQASEG